MSFLAYGRAVCHMQRDVLLSGFLLNHFMRCNELSVAASLSRPKKTFNIILPVSDFGSLVLR